MISARPRDRRLVLLILLVAYIFNFLDRQMLGILAQPIKAELHLSDTQFGAIGGLAFALLYAVLGVPLAYLADRTSRGAVVAGAVAVWSGFTALCGTAAGFGQLFAFRLGVGVGEAGGVAPSYALIADHFPPERRARALAIFSLGVPIGLAAGIVLGAYIAAMVNWRAVFFVMGAAGLILAPLVYLIVHGSVPRSPPRDSAKLGAVFAILARKPAFWILAAAASSSSLCGYGLALWTPSVLMRSFGLDLIATGQFLGSAILIGGVTGVYAGGWLADRLGAADRGWYARLPAIAWLLSAPAFALGLMAPGPWIAWPLLMIGNGLNIMWLGPVTTVVQHLVRQPLRATAAASFLLINNLIGLGVGPLLIGRLSDRLKHAYGIESLRNAAVATTVFYILAGLLMLVCVRRVAGAWVDDQVESDGNAQIVE